MYREEIVLVSKKNFSKIWGWRSRICELFEIIKTIYINSEMSEEFLEQSFNLLLQLRFLSSNTVIGGCRL